MKNRDRRPRNAAGRADRAVLTGMVLLMLVLSAVVSPGVDFGSAGDALNYFIAVITLAFTVLLFFFCINSITLDRRESRIFKWMIVIFFLTAVLLLLIGDSSRAAVHRLTMVLYTLLYLFSALYWLLFWDFQRGKHPHLFGEKCCGIIHCVFFGIYGALTVVNHFTGFCFSVAPDGVFVVRSYLLFYMTLAWFIIYLVLAMTTVCDLKTKLTLASYSLFPLLNWLLVLLFPDRAFYMGIFSALGTFLYLIPLYLLFFNVYLENGRLYLQRERELEESRANAMMLKISPHFISNVMGSIVALCDADAKKAGELAARFARYLRDNYTDMTDEQMIPFSKELEHIRNYLAVEQIRFPGLKVEYDVETEAFLIPTLAVQPLVENAVRHGISKRPDASGTVTIRAFEEERDYVIRILDDGIGFDTVEPRDDKKHVGIANARTRLALLCSGSLTVTGLPGQPTVCEIRIPKGE